MITVWYPTPPTPGSLPAPYLEPQLAPSLAGLYGVSQSVLTGLRSHAATGWPASHEAPFPVVLYSHGFKVHRRDNTAICVALASHGYFVVALDHADCLATVFPDGRVLTTTASGFSDALFQNSVADLRLVLEALTQMNRDEPFYRNHLDLQQVGTMGWSYGGGVAAELARTDARVKATVLLDAYLQSAQDVTSLGIQKPFLGQYNAASVFRTPFDQATQNAYWMNIRYTVHQHFADWRAWLSSPADSGRRAAVAMSGCIVAFFDKYLKARDDHLLDNPTNAYPELINFVRK
jgi:dienelactone hydrolase